MNKLFGYLICVCIFVIIPSVAFGQTPFASTRVNEALKAQLNADGKWIQILFADETVQTTAGTVTGVTGTAPIASSGGTTPVISLAGIVAVANGGSGTNTATGTGAVVRQDGATLTNVTIVSGTLPSDVSYPGGGTSTAGVNQDMNNIVQGTGKWRITGSGGAEIVPEDGLILGTVTVKLIANEYRIPFLIDSSGTKVTVSGTTTATQVYSKVIEGGLLGANGYLELITLWSGSSSANLKTPLIALGGTVFNSVGLSTSESVQHYSIIRNRNNINSQVAFIYTLGASFASSGSGPQLGSLNTNDPQTLRLTLQLDAGAVSAGETYSLESVILRGCRVP